MLFKRSAVLLLICCLAACGGGGGGGGSAGDAGVSVFSGSAEGSYLSTTDASELYVLDDGSFYLLNLGGAGAFYVYGTGKSAEGTFSGTGKKFFWGGELYTVDATVSATYTPQNSIDLTVTTAGAGSTVRTFTGNFIRGFLTPAKQSDVAGSYTNLASVPGITIDATGGVLIENSMIAPCQITGTVRPHGNDKLYDAELHFHASDQCKAQDFRGVAFLTGDSLLFVMQNGYYMPLKKA